MTVYIAQVSTAVAASVCFVFVIFVGLGYSLWSKHRALDRLRAELADKEERYQQALRANQDELSAVKAEAEAARKVAEIASQTKDQFLASMSHELRTPLNAIIGYSEMLQEEAERLGDKDYVLDLQKIHRAGKRLLDLINGLLDFSKIQSGKMTLYLESFEVSGLITEISSMIRSLVLKNGNRLVVDYPPDIGMMRADLTKVRQVLFNLLSNACKFTSNGTVSLTVKRSSLIRTGHDTGAPGGADSGGDWISFVVSDTGIGMSREQVASLFQAFKVSESGTPTNSDGTGLGLVISQKFCQLMGGELSVSSEPGRGSTFTVRIPAEVNDLSDTSDAARPQPVREGSATVLVIDDDQSARELMQRHLHREGYRVEVAATGEDGLRLARELKPAAITLDVILPGKDGWSVLASLKADRDLANIPVIMMTVVDEKKTAFALGAADYITKPIDWQRLNESLLRNIHAKAAVS